MTRVHQSTAPAEAIAVAAQLNEIDVSRDLLGLLILVVLVIVELLLKSGSVGG